MNQICGHVGGFRFSNKCFADTHRHTRGMSSAAELTHHSWTLFVFYPHEARCLDASAKDWIRPQNNIVCLRFKLNVRTWNKWGTAEALLMCSHSCDPRECHFFHLPSSKKSRERTEAHSVCLRWWRKSCNPYECSFYWRHNSANPTTSQAKGQYQLVPPLFFFYYGDVTNKSLSLLCSFTLITSQSQERT